MLNVNILKQLFFYQMIVLILVFLLGEYLYPGFFLLVMSNLGLAGLGNVRFRLMSHKEED
jgi:membrane protein implicated in regulation of membrane protease activity